MTYFPPMLSAPFCPKIEMLGQKRLRQPERTVLSLGLKVDQDSTRNIFVGPDLIVVDRDMMGIMPLMSLCPIVISTTLSIDNIIRAEKTT